MANLTYVHDHKDQDVALTGVTFVSDRRREDVSGVRAGREWTSSPNPRRGAVLGAGTVSERLTPSVSEDSIVFVHTESFGYVWVVLDRRGFRSRFSGEQGGSQ